MRRSWMSTIVTIAAAVSFGSSAAAANPHPNIVYIISDDQGWKDVGYHGTRAAVLRRVGVWRDGVRLSMSVAAPALVAQP